MTPQDDLSLRSPAVQLRRDRALPYPNINNLQGVTMDQYIQEHRTPMTFNGSDRTDWPSVEGLRNVPASSHHRVRDTSRQQHLERYVRSHPPPTAGHAISPYNTGGPNTPTPTETRFQVIWETQQRTAQPQHREHTHIISRDPYAFRILVGYNGHRNRWQLLDCFWDCRKRRYGDNGIRRRCNFIAHLRNCHGQNIDPGAPMDR